MDRRVKILTKRIVRPPRRIRKGKVAVIGNGSWGTAIVKLLLHNVSSVNWYVRSQEDIRYIQEHQHNPKYLTFLSLETEKINFYNSIETIIKDSEILFFSIPSAYLKETLKNIPPALFSNKFIVSAIKGIIPDDLLTITEYFNQRFDVTYHNMAVLSGPSHAEEIAMDKLTYLTIASKRKGRIRSVAGRLESEYLKTIISRDVYGVEYAGILKNIIAIASGICHGLQYGDNFQAVLLSNAIQEIDRFMSKISTRKRQINSSVYLGDMLVTCYSPFSRNRAFGSMIGKGYTVQTALLEMNMVAEGYFATKCIHDLNQRYRIEMPICNMVYEILYNNKPARELIVKLSDLLH